MHSAGKNSRITMIVCCITLLVTAIAFTVKPHQTAVPSFTDKYWKIESITVSPAVDLDMDGKPDADATILLEECDRDDAEMYKSDRTIIKHAGTKKCDDDDPLEEEVGEWSYNEATKTITQTRYDSDREPASLTVKEVSASKLVLQSSFTTTKNTVHQLTAVYKLK